jgi:carboxypeptidase A2
MGRVRVRTWIGLWVVALLLVATADARGQQPRDTSRATFSSAMFRGHTVVDVQVESPEDVQWLREHSVDFWSHQVLDGRLQVHMAPEHLAALEQSGLAYRISIPDLGLSLERHLDDIRQQEAQGGGGWYDGYKTFAEIETRLSLLESTFPSVMSVTVLGQTLEGRDLHLVELLGPNASGPVPTIVLTGGQHAREWQAHMTVMNLVETLASGYGVDPRITQILDRVRIYIAPMTNPDGFVHTWTTDRLWRKNRNPAGGACGPPPWACPEPGSECGWGPGVDLNRNWGWAWGGNPSDADPCGSTYRGTAAFSEAETQAVATFAQGLSPPPVAYLDIHAFSQVILVPWSYSRDPPPFDALHREIAQDMSDGMLSVHGKTYQVGTGVELLGYFTFGGADDWFLGALGAFGWTIEVRPEGGTPFEDGMIYPASEILPIAEENLEAVLRLAEFWTDAVWVDFAHGGTEAGSFTLPWNSVTEAAAQASSGQVLRLRAGTTSETVEIDTAMSLESFDGLVIIGSP